MTGSRSFDWQIRTLDVGTRLRLMDGSVVQVVDNPQDGLWLVCRPIDAVESDQDDDLQLVYCADIVGPAVDEPLD